MPPAIRSLVELLALVSPLLWAAWLTLLAIAAGSGVASRLAPRRQELSTPAGGGASAGLLRLALALTLGLGLLGQALFLAGICGRFGAPALAVVALSALGFGWRGLRAACGDAAALLRGTRPRAQVRWVLALCGLAGPAWLALYPPVAWDDTIYHLPLASSLLEHGRYLFVEQLRAPVFPLLAETLFAPALLVGRDSTAHGVSLVATLVTALLLLAWGCDRFAGAERPPGSRPWALAPAAIWIGQPIVVFYAASTFVEPLLTLFSTAALVAFERWRSERAPAWLLAAGGFAGWAAATKYHGLYLVAVLALAAAWEAARGQGLRSLARFAGAAALTGGPWYVLIWILAGNPLFPFFSSLFGASEWSQAAEIAQSGIARDWASRALDLLRLSWDLVLDRARTNAQPPVSALVVLAIPLVGYAGWRRRWTRLWIVLLAGYLVALLELPRDARYLMPFSPLLTILLVTALRDLVRHRVEAASARRRAPEGNGALSVACVLVVLGLATGPAYALYRTWRVGPPPLSAAAIDAHIARRVPLYRALLCRRELGLERVPVYVLHGERLHAFGGSALRGDWIGRYRYALVLPLLDRPAELARKLRELGAEELLLARDLVAPELVAGITASAEFRVLYRDAEAVLFALLPPASS